MPDFSNLEDEIPYPLPPTMVAPTTTKETTAPIVFQVPISSSACNNNTGTFKLPKKTLASTKVKKHVEKKKTANTVSDGSSHFSTEETIVFLLRMEEIPPFGGVEWQMVLNLHNNNHGLSCTTEALQQKFNNYATQRFLLVTHIVQLMFGWPRKLLN
jgi:hypothetical protein